MTFSAFQKAIANKNSLSTRKSAANLITLAKQCGIICNSLKELSKLQNLISQRDNVASSTIITTHDTILLMKRKFIWQNWILKLQNNT